MYVETSHSNSHILASRLCFLSNATSCVIFQTDNDKK